LIQTSEHATASFPTAGVYVRCGVIRRVDVHYVYI
jgi:hypothetical protein